MTTPLVKPLTREVLIGETAYRVTMTTDRISLTQKGRQRGVEFTWEELLARREITEREPAPLQRGTTPPRQILVEIAREVQAATGALAKAHQVLDQTGALPSALMTEMAPDPVYGRAEDRDDWFVEPLLTIAEVASILRLSTRGVRRLPLRTIILNGEARYRQSELREFLRKQEPRVR